MLSRKREGHPPREWYSKILRTRNGGARITADVSSDENKRSSENDGRDPLLRSTSAPDTRRLARRASGMGGGQWGLSDLRLLRIAAC